MATRLDGRLPNQLRPLSTEPAALCRADGSARYGHDRTQVICSVYGPCEAKRARERPDGAAIEVIVRPRAGMPGPVEREMEQLLAQTLAHLIITAALPRAAISVVVQVLADEGSLLAAAIGGVCVALMHSGVPLRGVLGACTVAILPDGGALLDPCAEEEREATAVATLAYLMREGADGSPSRQMLLSHMRGTTTQAEYGLCAQAAEQAVSCVADFYRTAFERSTAPLAPQAA